MRDYFSLLACAGAIAQQQRQEALALSANLRKVIDFGPSSLL